MIPTVRVKCYECGTRFTDDVRESVWRCPDCGTDDCYHLVNDKL